MYFIQIKRLTRNCVHLFGLFCFQKSCGFCSITCLIYLCKYMLASSALLFFPSSNQLSNLNQRKAGTKFCSSFGRCFMISGGPLSNFDYRAMEMWKNYIQCYDLWLKLSKVEISFPFTFNAFLIFFKLLISYLAITDFFVS